MKSGRRTSQDQEWQDVKRKVFARDPICRLAKVLSPGEYLLLKKNAGASINSLDPAHYISVANRPDLCYKSYNIVALNHYSHSLLDDFKNPITGEPITEEEANSWWIRILKGDIKQYEFLLSKGLIKEN